jgi:thiol-disulfide isomerase/thioredoxin
MININGFKELDNFLILNQDQIIMLYFGAKWCKPCEKLKTCLESNETKNNMPKLVIIDNKKNIKILLSQIFIKLINFKIKIIDRIDGLDWIKLIMIYNNIYN